MAMQLSGQLFNERYTFLVPMWSDWSLTGNDNAGVPGASLHRSVRGVGDGEDVRWSFVDFASSIRFHHVGAVDVHRTIRIYRHHHFADVRVNLTLLVPAPHANIAHTRTFGVKLETSPLDRHTTKVFKSGIWEHEKFVKMSFKLRTWGGPNRTSALIRFWKSVCNRFLLTADDVVSRNRILLFKMVASGHITSTPTWHGHVQSEVTDVFLSRLCITL